MAKPAAGRVVDGAALVSLPQSALPLRANESMIAVRASLRVSPGRATPANDPQRVFLLGSNPAKEGELLA